MRGSVLGRAHRTDLALKPAILRAGRAGFYCGRLEEVSPLFADTIRRILPAVMLSVIGVSRCILRSKRRRSRKGDSGLDEDRRIPSGRFACHFLRTLVLCGGEWLGTYSPRGCHLFALPLALGRAALEALPPSPWGFRTAVMILFTQAFQIYFQPGVFGLNLN